MMVIILSAIGQKPGF